MPRYKGSSGALSGTQYIPKPKKKAKAKLPVPRVFPIGPAQPISGIRPGPLVPANVVASGPGRQGIAPGYVGRSNPWSGAQGARPVPRPKPKVKAKAKPGPVNPSSRNAGAGARGTAATTPPQARSGAVAPRNLPANVTPTQRAKQQAARANAGTSPISSDVQAWTGQSDVMLTDEQQAQQIVEQMFAPDYADIQAQQQTQQAALQQFTNALIQQLTGQIAPVGQDYDLAQQQQTSLAQAASDQLMKAGTGVQAETSADLAAIGAPAEQQAQLAQQNANVFGGGGAVQFMTQGTIPGQSLAANRAAALTYARAQPGIAGLQGLDALRNITYNAGLARQKLGSEKRKSLFETTQALGDRRLKEQAAAQNQAIVEAQLGLKVQNQKFQQGATVQRLQNDKIRLGMSQLQNDRNWQATLSRLGISEAGLQIRAAESQAKLAKLAKQGGWTNSQVARFRTNASKIAKRSFEGEPIKEGGVVTGYRHWTYQEAMREMLSGGIPLTVAQAALNAYWNKPGAHQEWEEAGEGRPFTKFQIRPKGR